MTIETVIAIAKTLNPSACFIQIFIYHELGLDIRYGLRIDGEVYLEYSWEEVLRSAGWKG